MRIGRQLLIAIATLGITAGSAVAADMAMPMKAAPYRAPAEWLNMFGGFTTTPDSNYGEVGGVMALNHNLATDGWLIRLKGGYGHYDYNRAAGLGTGVNFSTADFMIGYQKYFGPSLFSAYIGANVQDHDNDSDPAATVRGTEWGVKVRGEYYTPFADRWYGLLVGEYSGAFDSYFAQGKVGYTFAPGISAGPEVASLGNERFDELRYGGFIAFDLTKSAQLILSGGYSNDNRANSLNDHSGGYGNVHIRANF